MKWRLKKKDASKKYSYFDFFAFGNTGPILGCNPRPPIQLNTNLHVSSAKWYPEACHVRPCFTCCEGKLTFVHTLLMMQSVSIGSTYLQPRRALVRVQKIKRLPAFLINDNESNRITKFTTTWKKATASSIFQHKLPLENWQQQLPIDLLEGVLNAPIHNSTTIHSDTVRYHEIQQVFLYKNMKSNAFRALFQILNDLIHFSLKGVVHMLARISKRRVLRGQRVNQRQRASRVCGSSIVTLLCTMQTPCKFCTAMTNKLAPTITSRTLPTFTFYMNAHNFSTNFDLRCWHPGSSPKMLWFLSFVPCKWLL